MWANYNYYYIGVYNLCVYTQDGAYFLALVDSEQMRLQQHCYRTERHLEDPADTIPEEGELAAFISITHLTSSHLI